MTDSGTRRDYAGRVKAKTASPQAFYYSAVCLPKIQEIVTPHGYALAVHGSLQNDLDLVLVPWVFDAGPPEPVIAEIAKTFSWWGEDGRDGIHGPTRKPHGRLAWSVIVGGKCFFDISIMPRGGRHENVWDGRRQAPRHYEPKPETDDAVRDQT